MRLNIILTAACLVVAVSGLECNICGEGNKMMEPKGIVTLITPDGETRKQNCDYWQKNKLVDESFCESGEMLQYTMNPCKCMSPDGTLLIDMQTGNKTLAPTFARDGLEVDDTDFEEDPDADQEEVDGVNDELTDKLKNDEGATDQEGEDLLDKAWEDAQTFAKSETGKQAVLVLLIIITVGLSVCCLGCCLRRRCRRSKEGHRHDANDLTLDPEYTEPAVYT